MPAQQQAMSLRDVTVVSKAGCRGREVGGVDGEDAVDDEKVEGVLWVHYARTDSQILLHDGADLAGGGDAGLDGALRTGVQLDSSPNAIERKGRQCINAAE